MSYDRRAIEMSKERHCDAEIRSAKERFEFIIYGTFVKKDWRKIERLFKI